MVFEQPVRGFASLNLARLGNLQIYTRVNRLKRSIVFRVQGINTDYLRQQKQKKMRL